jgi:hypothetical protein
MKKKKPVPLYPRPKSSLIAAKDFDRPVIYRGIKIAPIVGRRSPLARAIRDDLRKHETK